MSANLRNWTFSEISDPGAECFAPPEASCPNVGQEWGAKHSALLNLLFDLLFLYF